MATKVHTNQQPKEQNSESDTHVIRSSNHWAGALPAPQGLYDPEQEKDSCGVGFVCHIKGQPNHQIVSDARSLLCNMTHRGATGADARDGDGAGVMTGIPHAFFLREASLLSIELPAQGPMPSETSSSDQIQSKPSLSIRLPLKGSHRLISSKSWAGVKSLETTRS